MEYKIYIHTYIHTYIYYRFSFVQSSNLRNTYIHTYIVIFHIFRIDYADGTTITGNFSVRLANEVKGYETSEFANPYRDGEPNGAIHTMPPFLP